MAPSKQNQYQIPTGVYTPLEVTPPTIQVYSHDQNYSIDGHNLMSREMYDVNSSVDVTHGLQQQLYTTFKLIMTGSSSTQKHEMTLRHYLAQEACFEVA